MNFYKKLCLMMTLTVCILSVPNMTAFASKQDIHNEIIYKVIVDRYNNGNQKHSEEVDINDPYTYHGGDFKGITMKLDAIKASGFTTIAISPIMENAKRGYHGYWTTDFQKINKQFGTMDEFKKLVKEAHQRDLKIVLEFVTSYVADTSEIATNPAKSDWIIPGKITADVPWKDHAVSLNLENKDVVNYLEESAQYWINETGIDGFTLHALDQAPKTFVEKFTKSIKAKHPNFYIIGHILEDADAYTRLSEVKNIDIVTNVKAQENAFNIFGKVGNPVQDLAAEPNGLLYVDDEYSKRFGQHVGETGRNASTVWKLALTYMYAAPAVPSIYQGSEMPMYASGYPESQMMVQFNSGDPELKEYFERIAALRGRFDAFVDGSFEVVDSSEALTIFKRENKKETFYIAINNDDRSRAVTLKNMPENKQLNGFLGDNLVRADKEGNYTITLPRETAEIYMVEDNKGINWGFISFIIGVMVIFIISVIYLSKKQKKTA